MILKRRENTQRVANRIKNLFVLDTYSIEKAMLEWKKDQSTYYFSSNPQIWFWHYCLNHTSNTKIVQISKVIDKIHLGEIIDLKKGPKESFSSNLELENEDSNNKSAIVINKATENDFEYIKQLCKACIKNKHI